MTVFVFMIIYVLSLLLSKTFFADFFSPPFLLSFFAAMMELTFSRILLPSSFVGSFAKTDEKKKKDKIILMYKIPWQCERYS